MDESSNSRGASASGKGKQSRKAKRKFARDVPQPTITPAGRVPSPAPVGSSSLELKPEASARHPVAGDPTARDGGGRDGQAEAAGDPSRTRLLPHWLDPLALMLVVAALYARTLHHAFHFDDRAAIWDNPVTMGGISWANLPEIFSLTRPLAMLSFALNYQLGGLATLGYHLVNISIHAVNAVLLYYFIALTLRISPVAEAGSRRGIAFFTALLWAVHPLQVQSVTYIYQRMNSMAAMFFLGALLCYLGLRRTAIPRNRWLLAVLGVCLAILAVASKENAAILPVVILCYELYFFRNFDLGWLKWQVVMISGLLTGLCGLAVYLYLGKSMVWGMLSGSWGFSNWNFTMGQRLLTEARVVVFYLTQFLFPHPGRLNLDHDVAISTSLLTPPTTLFSLLVLLGLVVWSLVWAKRERLFSFCILWFFLCLAIESSFIGLEIIYEHRMYLPSMLTSLSLVLVLFRFVRPRHLRLVIVGCLVLVCGYWTVARNAVWATEISLWSDCVQKSPARARSHLSLAYGYLNDGRYDEAIQEFRQAVAIEPRNSDYLNSLSFALLRAGKSEESIAEAQKAIQVDPLNAMAYFNLGCSYEKIWRLAEALESYSEALRLSISADVRQERRVDPGKARQAVNNMKQMLSAMEKRRSSP